MAKIYIRADAAPKMGAGHVMRCLALLRGALDSGHQAILASRIEVPWVRERLERDNIPVEYLPLPIPSEENPIELLSQIEAYAPDWSLWMVIILVRTASRRFGKPAFAFCSLMLMRIYNPMTLLFC